MFLPILLRAEKALFSQLLHWGGDGTVSARCMIEVHFGCGGMKPENLQLGNVNCLAL